ncbi:uncharacterized protein CXQ87_001565 [Candidozyma duobushaemuli]|uniref:ICE2-domain-containing protein n=2 Tax=Candidozyma TaxID=3303203 RepID=A0ABX8I8S5_9ASCO|nr:uncharacterized protein CXQ87_001565 [[Candida] duobushaemulonis]PVH13460.1 hypothetical protein CXQ87_001565 [[Candida] duobushaemulonis]QWU88295.1 hypothetical protein CA3LBN_002560 [[Candida] haemuloni]
MRRVRNLVKSLFSIAYLALIVLTVPLAFDLGGVDCGLTYSLTILSLYFILTSIRLLARRYAVLKLLVPLYYAQHVFLPSILMYVISWCQNERHFTVVAIWRYILVHSTPVFTIAEGFCSLLLLQAVSQTLQWLTLYKSDSWLFVSLIGSGFTITGALYFLYRIYVLPFTIELGSASLLGSFLTLTVGLGFYGIVSGKGSMIESSLLFAYIVRCIYEMFPLLSDNAAETLTHLFTQTKINLQNEIPRLPPPLTNTISAVLPFLAHNLPGSFKTIWDFFLSSAEKLTLPLVVNLAYRIGVFYAATKIIPSLYHRLPYSPPRTPPHIGSRSSSSSSISPISSQQEEKRKVPRLNRPRSAPSTTISLIYAYSPCIIIAVYTHMMLSYNGELGTELKLWGWWASAPKDMVIIVHPWQFWNWVKMGTTLLLYMAELSGDSSSAMTSHWQVD